MEVVMLVMGTSETAREHRKADAACGRPWQCACGACNQVRATNVPDKVVAAPYVGSIGLDGASARRYATELRRMRPDLSVKVYERELRAPGIQGVNYFVVVVGPK